MLVLRVAVGVSAGLEAGLIIAGSHVVLRLTTIAAGSVVIAGLALVVQLPCAIARA
jgi:hypothetical protein